MLWGRFDNERSNLNMYDFPNFEAGSGIADTDDMVNELKEKFETIKGEHHAVIKAKLIAFLKE